MTIVLGVAAAADVSISRTALLRGRTLKGSFFGGVRPRSDLPSIVKKCVDKVSNFGYLFELESGE